MICMKHTILMMMNDAVGVGWMKICATALLASAANIMFVTMVILVVGNLLVVPVTLTAAKAASLDAASAGTAWVAVSIVTTP
jgi:hypothetical protein